MVSLPPLPFNSFRAMSSTSFQKALEDVASRFIANLPDEELHSFERLFCQLEQAYWFYTDNYCISSPDLPKMNLKSFSLAISSIFLFFNLIALALNSCLSNSETI